MPLFKPQLGRGGADFQMSCIFHQRLCLTALICPSHPSEVTFLTPPRPTAVKGLRRAIISGPITQPNVIVINENNAAQEVPVINAAFAIGLGKEWHKLRHLRVAHPEGFRHVIASF